MKLYFCKVFYLIVRIVEEIDFIRKKELIWLFLDKFEN